MVLILTIYALCSIINIVYFSYHNYLFREEIKSIQWLVMLTPASLLTGIVIISLFIGDLFSRRCRIISRERARNSPDKERIYCYDVVSKRNSHDRSYLQFGVVYNYIRWIDKKRLLKFHTEITGYQIDGSVIKTITEETYTLKDIIWRIYEDVKNKIFRSNK